MVAISTPTHSTNNPTSSAPAMGPFDVPAATFAYLERAATSLTEAMGSTDVCLRYAHAHVSALRATAALLAARATPVSGHGKRRKVQRNAWVLLAEVAPEFAEWAQFFSAGASKRAAAEAGSRSVTEREADDLIRDADRFLGVVEESLGLTRHVPVPARLAATSVPAHARASRLVG